MEKILIVDDEELNRDLLSAIFEEQFEVIEAKDGDEACHIIEHLKGEISIIFLDLMMPEKNGLEVLAYLRLKNLIDYIPVVMITGEATPESDAKAYEYGAADIIYKPFSSAVVTRRALNLIELYKSRAQMEAEIEKQNAKILEYQKEKDEMNVFLLDALGSVVEFKSAESGVHIHRVMQFTKILLDYVKCYYPKYNLTDRQVELMSQASALHDIGKIAIDDEILKAPRKLTPEEFQKMQMHTVYGCRILERFKMDDSLFFQYCYEICRWHHEKVDGRGYPDGLVGDQIPIYCQVASLADCFDALVSKRVYKEAADVVTAYNMILRGECGAFSKELLDCFAKARVEMFVTVEKLSSEEIKNDNQGTV